MADRFCVQTSTLTDPGVAAKFRMTDPWPVTASSAFAGADSAMDAMRPATTAVVASPTARMWFFTSAPSMNGEQGFDKGSFGQHGRPNGSPAWSAVLLAAGCVTPAYGPGCYGQ